jgi:hypothetical protein
METIARFYDWINSLLGVQTTEELILHPVFIGLCVLVFIYAVAMGLKWLSVPAIGLIGGALIYVYLYPEDTSDLAALLKFLLAMGGLALIVVYLGFIRD